jgi:hypothetical protein
MPFKPVRKVKPSSRSITGKYASIKTQTVHQFESTLERDFLTLLEFDDTVQEYGVQPVTIFYEYNGKSARYTPDMVVHYKSILRNPPLLCEIKYEAELLDKREYYDPKFRAATEYALENNYRFKVFTEKEIRTDYLSNIKFLSRYGIGSINDVYSEMVMDQLSGKSVCSINDLLMFRTAEEKARVLYTVWQMLSRHLIKCDMHTKLSISTMIWKSQN